MDDSVGRTTSLETGNPLMKWVDEMRTVEIGRAHV